MLQGIAIDWFLPISGHLVGLAHGHPNKVMVLLACWRGMPVTCGQYRRCLAYDGLMF